MDVHHLGSSEMIVMHMGMMTTIKSMLKKFWLDLVELWISIIRMMSEVVAGPMAG